MIKDCFIFKIEFDKINLKNGREMFSKCLILKHSIRSRQEI